MVRFWHSPGACGSNKLNAEYSQKTVADLGARIPLAHHALGGAGRQAARTPVGQGARPSREHSRMNVRNLKAFCLRFPGTAETLYGEPYNFLVYTVGGKKFAYFKTSQPERWRFSVRVSPERFVELTDVPGVKPARYRGRYHWVTIVNVSTFPPDYLAELVDCSYQRAFCSLSKPTQASILRAVEERGGAG
jgi:predicted DNA-binding protein (MmcQ/YjbR family)